MPETLRLRELVTDQDHHCSMYYERVNTEHVLPRYKIGDLGHVVAWSKEEACGEEGDCRYMAPEFMK